MTMPSERTRALRWMWEFLNEVLIDGNLTDLDQTTIKEILRHYPNDAEIRQWAVQESKKKRRFLEPEYPQVLETEFPELMRGPTTPVQRAQVIQDAYILLRCGEVNWSENQRRQIPIILRHFPSDDGGDSVSVERITRPPRRPSNQIG
jgi:hypothetical protein